MLIFLGLAIAQTCDSSLDYADTETIAYALNSYRITDIITDTSGSGTNYYIMDLESHYYGGITSISSDGTQNYGVYYGTPYGTYLKGTMNSDGSLIGMILTSSSSNTYTFGFANTSDNASFSQYSHNSVYPPYNLSKRNVDVKFSPNDGAVFIEASNSTSTDFEVGYVCRLAMSDKTYR